MRFMKLYRVADLGARAARRHRAGSIPPFRHRSPSRGARAGSSPRTSIGGFGMVPSQLTAASTRAVIVNAARWVRPLAGRLGRVTMGSRSTARGRKGRHQCGFRNQPPPHLRNRVGHTPQCARTQHLLYMCFICAAVSSWLFSPVSANRFSCRCWRAMRLTPSRTNGNHDRVGRYRLRSARTDIACMGSASSHGRRPA